MTTLSKDEVQKMDFDSGLLVYHNGDADLEQLQAFATIARADIVEANKALVAENKRLRNELLNSLGDVIDAKESMSLLGVPRNIFPEMHKAMCQQLTATRTALAAAQARETKLREIVSTLETKYSLNSEIRELCCPPTADDAALRDMISAVYEKCEQACNTARVDAIGCNAAEIIRTLSVNHWSS